MRQLSKRYFVLDVDTTNPQVQLKLAHIPGLTLESKFVRGSYDAVCLAAKRLDLPRNVILAHRQQEENYGARKPREYQASGITGISKRLDTYGGAILGDEMGLGKTYQALCSSQTLKSRQTAIICPARAKYTWRDEIKSAFPNAPVQMVKTGKDQILKDEGFVIASYDLAHVIDGQCIPEMAILDEAHKLRGRKTERFKRIHNLVSSTRYRLALTGTPLWNKPKDTWGVLDSILPHTFGSPSEFDLAYCDGIRNEWGGITNDGASRTDELRERISHYLVRRLKEDVAKEIPPIRYIPVFVDASREALEASHYARVNRTLSNIVNAEKATLECKIEAACEIAEDAKQFLLFTWMREHAERMATILQKAGTRCYFVHGGVSEAKRHEVCQLAIQQKVGLVATIDSLGESVNLQHLASTGIFHTIDPNPQKTAQAADRLHRLGITNNVTWYLVGARDSIDEELIATNLEKLEAAHSVIGATNHTTTMAAAMQSRSDDEVLEDIYKHMVDE